MAYTLPLDGSQDIWQWSLNPGIIAGLVITAVIYGRGWWRLRRSGQVSPVLRRRTLYFIGGIAALIIALLSPVDGLAESLLAMHMVQHSLLTAVAAPLLALSYPLPALLLGLPAGIRRGIGRGWRRTGWLRGLWRWLSRPLMAWGLQALLLWIWHAPGLYQAAIENEAIHAVEHLCFLGSALLFWWVAISHFARSQERRGPGLLYLLSAVLPGGLLGALLILSPVAWYPLYADRSAAFGLSALADQQLAGTIMGIPGDLVYLLAALLLLRRGVEPRAERRAES